MSEIYMVNKQGVINNLLQFSDVKATVEWLKNTETFEYCDYYNQPIYLFEKIKKDPDLWRITMLLGEREQIYYQIVNTRVAEMLRDIREVNLTATETLIRSFNRNIATILDEDWE